MTTENLREAFQKETNDFVYCTSSDGMRHYAAVNSKYYDWLEEKLLAVLDSEGLTIEQFIEEKEK